MENYYIKISNNTGVFNTTSKKTEQHPNYIIGPSYPIFVIAELGINCNGSVNIAKKLIDAAKIAGCNAVKFQKRTVDLVYTKEELQKERITPFGTTNGDLKRHLEFNYEQYKEIDNYCKKVGMIWFASAWDKKSVDFLEQFNVPCHKIASALLTDLELVEYIANTNKPIILSTGMSEIGEINNTLDTIKKTGNKNVVLLHCTSTYPTEDYEINLKMIETLKGNYPYPIGYSGHENGITPSIVACVLGACVIERHITLSRTMFGSDQAASLEPEGIRKLVREIRRLNNIMGDGNKIVYKREKEIIKKLRRI